MKIKSLIFPSIIVALLFFNPKEEQYLQDLSWQIKEVICDYEELSPRQQDICRFLGNPLTNSTLVISTLDSFSHRQNMLIFSIYTTDFGLVKVKAIGIAGNCFFFSVS